MAACCKLLFLYELECKLCITDRSLNYNNLCQWNYNTSFSEEDVNNNHNKKRIVVIVCILINLAILAIYKYGNFVIESVNSILNLLHIRVIQKNLICCFLLVYLSTLSKHWVTL